MEGVGSHIYKTDNLCVIFSLTLKRSACHFFLPSWISHQQEEGRSLKKCKYFFLNFYSKL